MTETVVTKRRYRNPLADHYDQFLFFVLFVLGTVAIWGLKVRGLGQITVTAVPLSLMLFYALVALVTKRFRLREDRVGDNIYYLGFLYTLVSLAYALYTYNPDGTGAAQIITNFGIAIFTTIFGLAGRVLFNQMREDPVEYEREARYSLAEASLALRSELADISTEMSSFKRKILQIIEEGVVDVSNSAKDSMAENVKSLTGVANEMLEKLRTAFETFTDHSGRLNEISSKNVEALEALFHRIERIEASPELLAAKLDPVIAKFDEVANEATRRNRSQTDDLKRFRDLIEVAVTAGEALKKTLATSDEAITKRLEHFSISADKTLGLAQQFSEHLESSTNALTAELASLSKAGRDLSQGASDQRKSLEEVRAAMEADLRLARRHRDELSGLVSESNQSVQALQSALVSMSRTMVEQLGGR